MTVDERKRLIVQRVRDGNFLAVAARAVRVTPNRVAQWMADDPKFALDLHKAEQQAEEEMLAYVRRAAQTSKRAKRWLKNRGI